MEEKKKFIIPEAVLVDFTNDDIITTSVGTDQLKWGDGGVDTDDF